MDAIDVLKAEHGLIRLYLNNLALALQKMERREHVSRVFFEHAVAFAREFIDTYHHFKEEKQMFALLVGKRNGELDAPVRALGRQHENGREHIAAIDDALFGYEKEQEKATLDLLEHLAAYVSLQRQHIHREDHQLFPLVREILTDEERTALMEQCKRADERAGRDFFAESRERVLTMEGLLTLS